MRISDWSSDVCSSDLFVASAAYANSDGRIHNVFLDKTVDGEERINLRGKLRFIPAPNLTVDLTGSYEDRDRSEEHTSELQSLMRNSYAVFCLKNKKQTKQNTINVTNNCPYVQQ